jgi:hypothetical protein
MDIIISQKTIPKIFQSNVSHLSDGDFIYYSEDNDKNIQHIFPVKISREPDSDFIKFILFIFFSVIMVQKMVRDNVNSGHFGYTQKK